MQENLYNILLYAIRFIKHICERFIQIAGKYNITFVKHTDICNRLIQIGGKSIQHVTRFVKQVFYDANG